MKFQRTPAFDADYRRLKTEHQRTFRDLVKEKFAPACDAHAAGPSRKWPASLRVKSVTGVTKDRSGTPQRLPASR